MALCGFRADNYRFGFPEGEGPARVLSLLEAIERGSAREQVAAEGDPLWESLRGSGIVRFRDGGFSLSPEGERLLETWRALLGPRLSASP